MKIMIVGASGTIGSALADSLGDHQVIRVGLTRGKYTVDISDPVQIDTLYEKVGPLDAVVMTTGKVTFRSFEALGHGGHELGINNKLLGQINMVHAGLPYLKDNGSFTLTSGILNRHPIHSGASAAMVNGAVDGFVVGASIEMPRGIRINAVSPTVLKASWDKYKDYFEGFTPVSTEAVVAAYLQSITGNTTGQVFTVDNE